MPSLLHLLRPATARAPFRAPSPAVWYARVFVLWVVVRTVAWMATIVAAYPNPPLDLIEWLSWGHSLEWGYPKHPPLPAWLAAGFARLSPGDVWGVYLLGYLSAAGCLAAAWTLGRRYLPPGQAALAVACLEGVKYLTNDPAEWSNNVALDLGWAWVVVLAHRAIRTGSTGRWGLVGVVAGLTLLCKYTLGLFLLPLGAFLLLDPQARRNLWRPGPYVAAAIAGLIFAPHAVWLVRHEFITLAYAAERSADAGGWTAHVRNPVVFLSVQVVFLTPVAFILYPALRRRPAPAGEPCVAPGPGASDRHFLHAVCLGPVAVLLLLSLATGCQLREIWASPLWTFAGVWGLAVAGRGADATAVRRGLGRAILVGAGMMAYVVVKAWAWPYYAPVPDRPHFPGRALAAEVNHRWNEQFDRPFPIAAGEAWGAGNICCFSPQHPVLYSNGTVGYLVFDSNVVSWVTDADLSTRGGVIVWNADQLGDDVPAVVQVRFPAALRQPPVVLPYQSGAPIPPARIGLAFVPPAR